VNQDKFAEQIRNVYHRTQNLQHRVKIQRHQKDVLVLAFEELRTALEELHVAEEELREQNHQLALTRQEVEKERQRYLELFEFAPDGYLVTDIDGKITEANRAAAELLKISQKYLIGKPLINYISLEERRAFRCQLLKLKDIELIREWETIFCDRTGIKFNAAITVMTVYDSQRNPKEWRWLVRDITERKRTEEKMRFYEIQNLELEEILRLKSQFLGVISHELRTPMNAILGFSQLLLRRYCHQLPHESRNMVERIINNGKHLLTLIEEILDFSRLEAKKLELTLQEINIVELVTETVEELRPLAEQKNLTLVVHIDIQNPQLINDSQRLRQVLVNLIANAIKFTHAGGVFVEVQQHVPNEVTLMIKDTGIGISQAELKYIFQEFWQANASTTRKHGGTGLGLAIVDKLVRLMNGSIRVNSKQGEGTTFQVVLPREVKK
jgi:PAS domain S-box-containing protein